MSALDIYQEQLEYNMGENGQFTEEAIFDPADIAVSLYGIFDEFTYSSKSDSSGNIAKQSRGIFLVSKAPEFDIYEKKQIYLTGRDKMYTIEYIEYDDNGVQKLWLV
jgi:hypothetical protein